MLFIDDGQGHVPAAIPINASSNWNVRIIYHTFSKASGSCCCTQKPSNRQQKTRDAAFFLRPHHNQLIPVASFAKHSSLLAPSPDTADVLFLLSIASLIIQKLTSEQSRRKIGPLLLYTPFVTRVPQDAQLLGQGFDLDRRSCLQSNNVKHWLTMMDATF